MPQMTSRGGSRYFYCTEVENAAPRRAGTRYRPSLRYEERPYSTTTRFYRPRAAGKQSARFSVKLGFTDTGMAPLYGAVYLMRTTYSTATGSQTVFTRTSGPNRLSSTNAMVFDRPILSFKERTFEQVHRLFIVTQNQSLLQPNLSMDTYFTLDRAGCIINIGSAKFLFADNEPAFVLDFEHALWERRTGPRPIPCSPDNIREFVSPPPVDARGNIILRQVTSTHGMTVSIGKFQLLSASDSTKKQATTRAANLTTCRPASAPPPRPPRPSSAGFERLAPSSPLARRGGGGTPRFAGQGGCGKGSSKEVMVQVFADSSGGSVKDERIMYNVVNRVMDRYGFELIGSPMDYVGPRMNARNAIRETRWALGQLGRRNIDVSCGAWMDNTR